MRHLLRQMAFNYLGYGNPRPSNCRKSVIFLLEPETNYKSGSSKKAAPQVIIHVRKIDYQESNGAMLFKFIKTLFFLVHSASEHLHIPTFKDSLVNVEFRTIISRVR
jgi:hypothetical protein